MSNFILIILYSFSYREIPKLCKLQAPQNQIHPCPWVKVEMTFKRNVRHAFSYRRRRKKIRLKKKS